MKWKFWGFGVVFSSFFLISEVVDVVNHLAVEINVEKTQFSVVSIDVFFNHTGWGTCGGAHMETDCKIAASQACALPAGASSDCPAAAGGLVSHEESLKGTREQGVIRAKRRGWVHHIFCGERGVSCWVQKSAFESVSGYGSFT